MRFEAVEFDFEVFDVALFSFTECALAGGREKVLAGILVLPGVRGERAGGRWGDRR